MKQMYVNKYLTTTMLLYIYFYLILFTIFEIKQIKFIISNVNNTSWRKERVFPDHYHDCLLWLKLDCMYLHNIRWVTGTNQTMKLRIYVIL